MIGEEEHRKVLEKIGKKFQEHELDLLLLEVPPYSIDTGM